MANRVVVLWASADHSTVRVAFPQLRSVQSFTLYGPPAVTTLDLSSLVTAGEVKCIDCGTVTTVLLPAFETGYLRLTGLSNLVGLELPAFQSGGFVFDGSSLSRLEVPNLVSAAPLQITKNNALTEVSLPKLSLVTTDFIVGDNPLFPNCEALQIWQQAGYPSHQIYGNDEAAVCE